MKLIMALIGTLALLTACGKESAGPVLNPHPVVANEGVPNSIGTFVIEADGVLYRCIDKGGYSGGIWCTRKPGN